MARNPSQSRSKSWAMFLWNFKAMLDEHTHAHWVNIELIKCCNRGSGKHVGFSTFHCHGNGNYDVINLMLSWLW